MRTLYYILAATVITLATTLAATAGTVTKSGKILTVTGSVDEQMWDEFEPLFTSDVNHIKLSSNGGSVYWGYKIVTLIEARKDAVWTEATDNCASMCAMIWMSSDKHVYNSNGRIGFHFSYADIGYLKDVEAENGIRGLEKKFKQSAIWDLQDAWWVMKNKSAFGMFMHGLSQHGIMNVDMWYPTNEQLVQMEGGWSKPPVVKPACKIVEGRYVLPTSADTIVWYWDAKKEEFINSGTKLRQFATYKVSRVVGASVYVTHNGTAIGWVHIDYIKCK